jgi:hypothetical protein
MGEGTCIWIIMAAECLKYVSIIEAKSRDKKYIYVKVLMNLQWGPRIKNFLKVPHNCMYLVYRSLSRISGSVRAFTQRYRRSTSVARIALCLCKRSYCTYHAWVCMSMFVSISYPHIYLPIGHACSGLTDHCSQLFVTINGQCRAGINSTGSCVYTCSYMV